MNANRVGASPWNLRVGYCCMMIALGTSLPTACEADDPTTIIAAENSDQEHPEVLFPIRKGGKWGYMNQEGRVVVEPSYDNARQFHDGRHGAAAGPSAFGVAQTAMASSECSTARAIPPTFR